MTVQTLTYEGNGPVYGTLEIAQWGDAVLKAAKCFTDRIDAVLIEEVIYKNGNKCVHVKDKHNIIYQLKYTK